MSQRFIGSSLPADLAVRIKPAGYAPDGRELVTAVAQDATSSRVLMVAWMDATALSATLTTGQATYYSRSRQELWVKGATSGHTQQVREMLLDCDGDSVLLRVDQVGAACHTGELSCFFTVLPLAVPAQGAQK